MSRVFFFIPHSGTLAPEVLDSIAAPPTLGEHEVHLTASGISLLAFNFNGGWAGALNMSPRPDYFLMHHSDIGVGGAGWLDYMISELERTNADVLSVVVPIKDGRGLSSTGLLRRTDGKHEHRRVTMKELDALPDTFTREDVRTLFDDAADEHILTVNTGLFIARFDRPWVEDVCFTIKDRLTKNADGTTTAHCWPEDWNFSEWCYDKGLRVVANKKVPVGHRGGTVFNNQKTWGLDHDDWSVQPAGDL